MPLAEALDARGYDSLIEPMLTILPDPADPARLAADLEAAQAILVTSANGARALAACTTRRDLPAMAVGDASAAAARALGFRPVASAEGDVEALARLIASEAAAARLDPAADTLFHPAGSAVAGDLAGAVEALGFRYMRRVLYRAEKASGLSPGCVAALTEGRVAAALFFSPRTARHFVALIEAAGLEAACGGVDAHALSPAVAEVLGALPWRTVYACASPSQAALLEGLPPLPE